MASAASNNGADNKAKRQSMVNVERAPLDGTGHDSVPAPPPKQSVVSTVRDMASAERRGHHLYITGLKGILVLESFLWTFFVTFIPTLASPTLVHQATPGPVYQDILREIFSVPLWNYSFIYNFFIILSMRTIPVSFLQDPTGQTYAATVIRRILRMVVVICIASGMATGIFSAIGVDFINEFKARLPNRSIETPVVAYDGVAAANSLFQFFWITEDFFNQAANNFWPTSTLWVSSIIYFQSFTVYFCMVILPYTRPKWHIQGMGLFAAGSFWMGYWGWYSMTGMIFADIAINTTLKNELKAGLKINSRGWRIPYWSLAITSFAIGIALKYTFVVRPRFVNSLVYLHPYVDLLEGYSLSDYVDKGPYARLDDWLMICGILLAVESFSAAQHYLSFKPLVWLGERSFSIFTAQCIIFYTGGIKLWLALSDKGLSNAAANIVVLIVCFVAIIVFSELYYRVVDLPSRWLARNAYLWLVN